MTEGSRRHLVVVGAGNAVNLTDGLDGLAIMPTVLVSCALGVFAYASGNAVFAEYLQIPRVPGAGELVIICAAIAGAGRVIAVDMLDSKLELARKMGATDAVNAKKGDPVAQVKDLTGGGVDYSFEAIGLKIAAEQAFGMLKNGGTATVIGMIPIGQKVELPGVDFLFEKKIQGSNMGSNRFRTDMPKYVDMYLNGKLNLDDLVSRRIKLEDVNEAFAQLETGEVARSVIMMS